MTEIEADHVALEIHRRFWAKMQPKGEIDKILAGGVGPKPEHLPDDEIENIKRQINAQMAEYSQAIADALAWHGDWKDRQPKGFKALRRAK